MKIQRRGCDCDTLVGPTSCHGTAVIRSRRATHDFRHSRAGGGGGGGHLDANFRFDGVGGLGKWQKPIRFASFHGTAMTRRTGAIHGFRKSYYAQISIGYLLMQASCSDSLTQRRDYGSALYVYKPPFVTLRVGGGGGGAVVEVISMLSMGVLELYSVDRSKRVERERG